MWDKRSKCDNNFKWSRLQIHTENNKCNKMSAIKILLLATSSKCGNKLHLLQRCNKKILKHKVTHYEWLKMQKRENVHIKYNMEKPDYTWGLETNKQKHKVNSWI